MVDPAGMDPGPGFCPDGRRLARASQFGALKIHFAIAEAMYRFVFGSGSAQQGANASG